MTHEFNRDLIEDLSKLIDYSYKDEEYDYNEQKEMGEETVGHIFESIKRLADWLDSLGKDNT